MKPIAWQNGDPANAVRPRGKSRRQRKGRYDGGLTPTEQRTKDRLMKQFVKLEGPSGNSPAYVASGVWCACGAGVNRRGEDGSSVPCWRCAPDAVVEGLTT